MPCYIKNLPLLKKLLWLDTSLGCATGIAGLLFASFLHAIFGLTESLIVWISGITLFYGIVAFVLANQKSISVPLLRTLIYANWAWAVVSVFLFYRHYPTATMLGVVFLLLQVIVVGGLAYLEGKQLAYKEV